MKGRDINSVGLRRECARKTNVKGRERRWRVGEQRVERGGQRVNIG